MRKINIKILVLSLFLIAYLFTGYGALAQQGIPNNAFLGEYFKDTQLGSLALTRTDNVIDFNWGEGSPDPSIGVNGFSVRWQGNFSFNEHWWEFNTLSDDGVRVFVDDKIVIDDWKSQEATSYSSRIFLTQGVHRIEVLYFEGQGGAKVKVNWKESDPPVTPTLAASSPTPSPTIVPQSYCVSLIADKKVGVAPLTVKFVGKGFDSRGAVLEYNFDFGDTSPEQSAKVVQKTTQASHIYKSAGIYTASLQIKDSKGKLSDLNPNCQVFITVNSKENEEVSNASPSSDFKGELPKTGTFFLGV